MSTEPENETTTNLPRCHPVIGVLVRILETVEELRKEEPDFQKLRWALLTAKNALASPRSFHEFWKP